MLLPLALGAVALVGGWHYLCHLELEEALTNATNEFVREHIEDASAHVEIGPFNNVIDVRVGYSKQTTGMAKLVERAVIEAFKEQLEPKIERALHTRTRRSLDVYAMLLPYKVSFTVGDSDSLPRVSGAGLASGEDILMREVQQALSECGYDLGQPDGVLGPKTDRAISAFRQREQLAERSIPLKDLPGLVRQSCPRTTAPEQIKQLLVQSDDLNDKCRGGSGEDAATWAACEQRDEITKSLEAQGWCYGHDGEAGYQKDWEPCRVGEQSL